MQFLRSLSDMMSGKTILIHLRRCMFTDKLFTGQREMEGLGIYHYGARFYSPKLARFISADTIVPGGANPQAFNRYSYVFNNPLRYIDPTGHMPKVTPIITCDLDCWRAQHKDDDDSGGGRQARGIVGATAASAGKNYWAESNNEIPKLCQLLLVICNGGRNNPINYDTIGIKFDVEVKLVGGAEFKPYIMIDGKSLRDLDWSNMDMAFGASGEFSIGASAEEVLGVSISGSDGSILDQMGIQSPTGNAGGCFYLCVLGSKQYDLDKGEITSTEYTVGYSNVGPGIDISVGLGYNDFVYYGDPSRGVGAWHIPFTPILIPYYPQ